MSYMSSVLLPTESDSRILFIGNSMTYFNDMPGMVVRLGIEHGRKISYDLEVGGGSTLIEHLCNPRVIKKLSERAFQYVVLQEQSTLPLEDLELYSDSVRRFAEHLQGIPTYLLAPFVGSLIKEKQLELFRLSRRVAEKNGVIAVENEKAYRRYPASLLFGADGHHPSPFASYINAWCIYSAVLQKDLPKDLHESWERSYCS